MDDVRGDFLGPPHGTTPAAVTAKKYYSDSLRAVSILTKKEMGHTMVSATEASSVTLQIWQHGNSLRKHVHVLCRFFLC